MNANRCLITSVAPLALMLLVSTLVETHANPRDPKSGHSFRPPTLRKIDKVELMSIESRMGNIEAVDATRFIEGKEAQNILRIWRKQKFSGYSAAACHQPPYAIKFYAKGKVVLFATICWQCHNVTFIVPNIESWVEFASDSKDAKIFKEIFQKAFPSENKSG